VSETAVGKTSATWAFYGDNKFPFSIMMLFMDMDEMMGPAFDRGLTMLKEISEKQAQEISQYQVEEIDWPGKIYATLRRTVSMNNIARFYAESYQKIGIESKTAGARMTGMPCGLYYSWDEQNKETDLAAAIPINRKYKGEKVETIEIKPQKAYLVNYYGPYDGLSSAHLALHIHMAKNGISPAFPCLEEYATDPGGEPDPSKWLTKVYYFAKN
jgi:effector-binding domain-containing protein